MTPKERFIWLIKNRPIDMMLQFVLYPAALLISVEIANQDYSKILNVVALLFAIHFLIGWAKQMTHDVHEAFPKPADYWAKT